MNVEKDLCFVGNDLIFVCYIEDASDPINIAFRELSIERGYKVNNFYDVPSSMRKDIKTVCFVSTLKGEENVELSRIIFIVPLEIDKILAGKTKEE